MCGRVREIEGVGKNIALAWGPRGKGLVSTSRRSHCDVATQVAWKRMIALSLLAIQCSPREFIGVNTRLDVLAVVACFFA